MRLHQGWLLAGLMTLTGCSGAVSIEPAANASDPACAYVTLHLPESVGDGLQQRETNAQAAGAWGEPARVFLRCGVEALAPTTLPCLSFGDVDWIIDEGSHANLVLATTYGRQPAVEVAIDKALSGPGTILEDLAPAVRQARSAQNCNW
jgi:hypothetical protein